MSGKADWDLANFNAAENFLKNTLWNIRFTELEEACRCADVAVNSSVVRVANIALGSVLDPIAGIVSSIVSQKYPI